MAGSGSRGKEQIPSKDSIDAVWEKRLADAVSVFQTFNASLRVGSEVERQTQSKDSNSNRPKGPGIIADDSRFPTLDLAAGLGKFAGRPALSLPQVLNGAQQRAPVALEGQQVVSLPWVINGAQQRAPAALEGQQAVSLPQVLNGAQQRAPAALEGQQAESMNTVIQLLKEGEEADAILMRNLSFTKKRREDLLRVVLSKINDSMVTTGQLVRDLTGFPDIVNSWKQEMMLQKRKHDKIVTDLQDDHDKAVTELHDERKNSEYLLVQKYKEIIKEMEQAPCRKAEPTILVETHERIVSQMQDLCKKTETALSQQHDRTIAEFDARKEEEAAQLIRKHEGIVTKMQEERKEAETALTLRHERVISEMREERKKSETLLVQKHDGMITEIQEAWKEAETLLIQKHQMAVMEMRDVHEADRRRIQKYEMTIREFEMGEARKKADQIMFIHNHKKQLSAQVDSYRRAEALLNQKHGKAVTEIEDSHKEAEKLLIQNHEKIIVEADEARKENEAGLLRDHKVEMDAGKEREKEILQKQSEFEAEVVKFKKMYHMAQDSYVVLQKEHGEAKQAMQAQLASLQCQIAALKEEERTREKEHAEEVRRAMNAVPKCPESQLPTYKYKFKTRSQKELEFVSLQSKLAELQNDKVELQQALDALRDDQDRKIESKSNKLSIELLWEVAQTVLSFPKDVKESQTINTSGYETLVSTREENNVDKMMDCVNVALKTAATNWQTAQDDYAKLKLASRKHVKDTIRDISGDSKDSETNEREEELPQKKRTRLFSLTELKELRERRGSSSQQEHPSRRKRTTPRRFVPGSS